MIPTKVREGLYGQVIEAVTYEKKPIQIRVKEKNEQPVSLNYGSEGFGFKGEIIYSQTSKEDCFIKFYESRVAERESRIEALYHATKKIRHLEPYYGIPMLYVKNASVGKYFIDISISKDLSVLGMEDYKKVRESPSWYPTFDDRMSIATQLCSMISTLHDAKIVHGDLSPANIMIGKNKDDEYKVILIDYDGFYIKGVPLLPLRVKINNIRTYGTDGFILPRILDSIERKNFDVVVDTDLFALGISVVEILMWSNGFKKLLNSPRETLLTKEMLKNRSLETLEPIIKKHSKLLNIIEKMLRTDNNNELPTPEDWLETMVERKQSKTSKVIGFEYTPAVRIRERKNTTTGLIYVGEPKRYKLEKNAINSFRIHNEILKKLKYRTEMKEGKCYITVTLKSDEVIHLAKESNDWRISISQKPNKKISISPADSLFYDRWQITFMDVKERK